MVFSELKWTLFCFCRLILLVRGHFLKHKITKKMNYCFNINLITQTLKGETWMADCCFNTCRCFKAEVPNLFHVKHLSGTQMLAHDYNDQKNS